MVGTEEFHLVRTSEQNLWKILPTKEPINKEDVAQGYVALYVDDVMAVGNKGLVDSFLAKIQEVWKCSKPEYVSTGAWMKFCGFEISRQDGALLLSQRSYVKDVLGRYSNLSPKTTPLPALLDEGKGREHPGLGHSGRTDHCRRTFMGILQNPPGFELCCGLVGPERVEVPTSGSDIQQTYPGVSAEYSRALPEVWKM